MFIVIIATNLKSLKNYLKTSPVKYNFINLGQNNSSIEKFLKENSHKKIEINTYSESFKEKFFKSYIDMIGHLGTKLNSIYWWASFTASKNRFISQLLPSLFIYCSVCRAIMEHKTKNIILISPPIQIIQTLRRFCIENSIEFKMPGYSIFRFHKRLRKSMEHLMRIVYFIANNWSRIYIARKYFKRRHQKDNSANGFGKHYVLRTWVYSSSINDNNKFSDSFFGRLPRFLSSRDKNIFILAGIIGKYGNIVKRLSKCREYLIFPQEVFLNYSDVVKSALDCMFNRIRIKEKINFYGFNILGIMQEEFDRDYRNYIRNALLQKYIIRNLLKYYRVDTFITTYENNPWERICFLSLRKNSPSTKIIGYQHAVVTRASANMFMSKEESAICPVPDRIVTVGEVPKEIMERYGNYPDGLIMPSCALRHEYIYKLKKKDLSRNNRILVALEGVPECYTLVNFVFDALKHTKDYRVVIRTHPQRPFEQIKDALCFDMNLYDNFSVSEQKELMDDLNASDILIYWGSTVSLEALMMGLPVIHVNLNDLVSVDPLSDCKYLKWSVKNHRELSGVISEIYNLPREHYAEQYSKARAYIEKYLQEVTDERLQEFIL